MSDIFSSDIVNYVTETSSTQLDATTYTDEDALVLAELSYFKFDEIASDSKTISDNGSTYTYDLSQNGNDMTVSEYAQYILDNNNGGTKMSNDQIAFLNAVSDSDRYDSCTIHDFAAADITDSQWAAYTVDLGDNTSVIAMRGTDGTTMGWTEDLNLVYDATGTNAQNYSAQYLENCTADSIYMTGHSKGGSDVTSAYVLADEQTRAKVEHIANFDGPGMNEEMIALNSEAYSELGTKLDNYYPENSVVGLLLTDNPGTNHFIDAHVREDYFLFQHIGEHDPFSFQFNNGSFSESPQTNFSKSINYMLDETVKDLSHAERVKLATVLEQMGIPSLIAKKPEELSYYVSDETAHEVLEILNNNNKYALPESFINALDGPAGAIMTVYGGFIAFASLSDEEKNVLFKTVGYSIMHKFEYEAAYKITRIDDLTDLLAQTWDKEIDVMLNYLGSFNGIVGCRLTTPINGFFQGLTAVSGGMFNQVSSLFQFFANGSKTVYAAEEFSNGIASFNVKASNLITTASEIQSYADTINQYYDSINSIQSGMGWTLKLLVLGSITKVKSALSSESSLCQQYGQKLEEIARVYESFEADICNNVESILG